MTPNGQHAAMFLLGLVWGVLLTRWWLGIG